MEKLFELQQYEHSMYLYMCIYSYICRRVNRETHISDEKVKLPAFLQDSFKTTYYFFYIHT